MVLKFFDYRSMLIITLYSRYIFFIIMRHCGNRGRFRCWPRSTLSKCCDTPNLLEGRRQILPLHCIFTRPTVQFRLNFPGRAHMHTLGPRAFLQLRPSQGGGGREVGREFYQPGPVLRAIYTHLLYMINGAGFEIATHTASLEAESNYLQNMAIISFYILYTCIVIYMCIKAKMNIGMTAG